MTYHLLLRETGLVEGVCEHGVGHPIPESAAYKDLQHGHAKGTWGVHGCDGCCGLPDFPQTVDRAWLKRTTGLDIP